MPPAVVAPHCYAVLGSVFGRCGRKAFDVLIAAKNPEAMPFPDNDNAEKNFRLNGL